VIKISGKNVKKNQSSFLQANEVTTLNWAARSPDLNPIENIWGIMAKEINAECPQKRRRVHNSVIYRKILIIITPN
jgi:hypothetical protein